MTRVGFLNKSTGDLVEFELIGNKINRIFVTSRGFKQFTSLKGIKWSVSEIVRRYPDLKELPIQHIKEEGIKRFEKYLEEKKTQQELIEYLMKEMILMGYSFKFIQREGSRPIKNYEK